MKTIQILEPDDIVKSDDWCRPLRLISDGGNYMFEGPYSGTAMNNLKWVRVEDVFGIGWFDKPAKELSAHDPYEFVRGEVPPDHRLTGHRSLVEITAMREDMANAKEKYG